MAKDSDDDSASNGEVFGDAYGDEKPTAGATITNPGDANSKPPKPVKRMAPVIALRSFETPFGFQFKTAKGVRYEIQASADLRKWAVIGSVDGTVTHAVFTDLREAIFERQYYRVKIRD